MSATVRNAGEAHEAMVQTDGISKSLAIPGKRAGGSSVNGGELLLLALATCYCNDLYREAARLNVAIDGVEVQVAAEFPGVGLAARDIRYSATISSTAPASDIANLLQQTDAVAEVHNTLRSGATVELVAAPHPGSLGRRRTAQAPSS
jgi:organic hydroperoxide reductase OsmC/OhrA